MRCCPNFKILNAHWNSVFTLFSHWFRVVFELLNNFKELPMVFCIDALSDRGEPPLSFTKRRPDGLTVRSDGRTDGNSPLCFIGHRPLRVRCPKALEFIRYAYCDNSSRHPNLPYALSHSQYALAKTLAYSTDYLARGHHSDFRLCPKNLKNSHIPTFFKQYVFVDKI